MIYEIICSFQNILRNLGLLFHMQNVLSGRGIDDLPFFIQKSSSSSDCYIEATYGLLFLQILLFLPYWALLSQKQLLTFRHYYKLNSLLVALNVIFLLISVDNKLYSEKRTRIPFIISIFFKCGKT